MHKLAKFGVTAATVAAFVLSGGVAMAQGGGGGGGGGCRLGGTLCDGGVWPANYPLPTGTVTEQSKTEAVVQSPDTTTTVLLSLDDIYVNQLGCTETSSATQALDFLCVNPTTGKTDNVGFTFNSFDLPGSVQSIEVATLVPGT